MDVDALLEELETVDALSSAVPDPNLAPLEQQVQHEKERRARCFRPNNIPEDKRRFHSSKDEAESNRNTLIRNFLDKTSLTAPPHQHSITTSQSSSVFRFVTEVKGTPLSVTSARTGDRVYCSCPTWEEASEEGQLQTEATQLMSFSVEQIRQRMAETTLRVASPEPEPINVPKKESSRCWVHKYAPRSFSDLVTDDRLNRDLMKWLSSWRANPAPSSAKSPRLSDAGKNPGQSSFKKGDNAKITDFYSATKNRSEDSAPTPPMSFSKGTRSRDPPEHRVLILCGPPGVGKTHLVHTAARLCKYRPFVIDAAADRSPAALQSTLLDVLEAKNLLHSQLPSCIIFDEIDTLPPGAESRQSIQKIVEFVQGRHRKDRVLKRPMIFICNELHAPYLAPLRSLAKILYVPHQKVNTSLVTRLQKICAEAGLPVELAALHVLVEQTRNDISACLNALQFQSSCDDAAEAGVKIMKQTPFQLWNSILIPAQDKRSFEALMQLYERFESQELILTGVFWNYTQMHLQDGQLRKSKQIAQQLSKASCMARWISSYCPTALLAIRRWMQTTDRSVKIEWPREDFDHKHRLYNNRKSLWSFSRELSSQVHTCVSPKALATELLPYCTVITQTQMPALNLQHCLNGECRRALLDLVKASTRSMSDQESTSHGRALEAATVCKRTADEFGSCSKRPRVE